MIRSVNRSQTGATMRCLGDFSIIIVILSTRATITIFVVLDLNGIVMISTFFSRSTGCSGFASETR